MISLVRRKNFKEKNESVFLVSTLRPIFDNGKKATKHCSPSASKIKGFKRHDYDYSEGGPKVLFKD